MAQQFIIGVAERSAADGWPLCPSAGWKSYQPVLLGLFFVVIHFIKEKRGGVEDRSEERKV
jgi:hypothetical protein